MDIIFLYNEMEAISNMDVLGKTDSDHKVVENTIKALQYVFDAKILNEMPEKNEDKIIHVFELATYAYCCGRWPEFLKWIDEKHNKIITIPNIECWDDYVFYELLACWLIIYNNESLDQIENIISKLRKKQYEYEKLVLNDFDPLGNRKMAYKLIGYYYWIKATELVVMDIKEKNNYNSVDIEKMFKFAILSLSNSQIMIEMLLRWVIVASRIALQFKGNVKQ